MRWPLLGAVAAALVVAGTGGATHLGSLQLGHANTSADPTTLTANLAAPVLKVVNQGGAAALRGDAQNGIGVNGVAVTGTGQQGQSVNGVGVLGIHSATTGINPGVQGQSASTDPNGAGVVGKNTGGGPGLKAVVNAGAPPLAVNSSTKVANLNADLLDGLDAAAFWRTTGNAGTTPGTNFLGTSDNQALEVKVNGLRALRIEPDLYGRPNLIGGHPANSVDPGVTGAVIGGGGGPLLEQNRVTGSLGTVSGGSQNTAGERANVAGGETNTASALWSTVGGGRSNTASDTYATVGGGALNTAGIVGTVGGGSSNEADRWAAVGGGDSNIAGGDYSTIAGGRSNAAGGFYSTVAGGSANVAGANWSFAAGNRAKANHTGAFVWADSTIADFSSTASDQFLVRAAGGARFVTGMSSFSTTGSALQVENATASGEAAWLRIGSSASPHPVVSLIKQDGGLGNFLTCWNESSGSFSPKCHIDKDGTFVAGSDFAESLPARGGKGGYEPGDVLVASIARPGQVERSHRRFDRAVLGVYSTRPAVLGADEGGITRVGENDVPVAITGIVPVKASAENGAIRPGDLLTSASSPGYAMRAGAHPAAGSVLGKALSPLRAGTGRIKMLVLPAGGASRETGLRVRIRALERENAALTSRLNRIEGVLARLTERRGR